MTSRFQHIALLELNLPAESYHDGKFDNQTRGDNSPAHVVLVTLVKQNGIIWATLYEGNITCADPRIKRGDRGSGPPPPGKLQ